MPAPQEMKGPPPTYTSEKIKDISPSVAQLKGQISQQLDRYISKFNDGDFGWASSNYHEPTLFISAQAVVTLSTREDIMNNMSSTVEHLRKDGFSHTEWAGNKNIILLDENGLALASYICKRFRTNGTLSEEFSATYTPQKIDSQGWLITAVYQHPIETQLQ